MSSAASLAALRAHADAFRAQRQRERAHAVWQDLEVRRLWTLGWSQPRIAAAVGLSVPTISRRIGSMGLPRRAAGFRIQHAGLSAEQMAVYRLYAGKGFSVVDARAAALREAA